MVELVCFHFQHGLRSSQQFFAPAPRNTLPSSAPNSEEIAQDDDPAAHAP